MQIGKLTKVDVRELWKHEQHDFSKWLAKEENIKELESIIGLTLVDVEPEVSVGNYRCDLVAKDETTDTTVIIENQLETSDHDHLGKIITYASGLSADVIVWIVKEARPEHRSAIEWLNNNTNKNISFFLIELHAYRIGNSIPAPKFEIIEMPNDFIKDLKAQQGNATLNETQSEWLNFWTLLNTEIKERKIPLNTRKAPANYWYPIALGTSVAMLDIILVNKENYVGIEIYIFDNKDLFDNLFEYKEIIEQETELSFEWNRLDDKKASRIIHKIDGLNFDDKSNYPQLIAQIIDKVTKLKPIFSKYLKELI